MFTHTTEVMELPNTKPLFAYSIEATLEDGSSRRATLWCVDLREAIKLSRFMFKRHAVIVIDGKEQ